MTGHESPGLTEHQLAIEERQTGPFNIRKLAGLSEPVASPLFGGLLAVTVAALLLAFSGDPLVLFIGAIFALKGLDMVAQALCSLDNRFVCWHCWRTDRRYGRGTEDPYAVLRRTLSTYKGPLALFAAVAVMVVLP